MKANRLVLLLVLCFVSTLSTNPTNAQSAAENKKPWPLDGSAVGVKIIEADKAQLPSASLRLPSFKKEAADFAVQAEVAPQFSGQHPLIPEMIDSLEGSASEFRAIQFKVTEFIPGPAEIFITFSPDVPIDPDLLPQIRIVAPNGIPFGGAFLPWEHQGPVVRGTWVFHVRDPFRGQRIVTTRMGDPAYHRRFVAGHSGTNGETQFKLDNIRFRSATDIVIKIGHDLLIPNVDYRVRKGKLMIKTEQFLPGGVWVTLATDGAGLTIPWTIPNPT